MNPPASTASRTAWIMVLLLFPVALLNYLDRQMLATMQKSMVSDIPTITNEEAWGSVLAAFKWTYAFLSPIGGFIADRFSRRHVICFSLFAWSIVTWVTGHVTTMDQLIWARPRWDQRGVLHPGRPRPDRRFPHRRLALDRRGRAPDRHLHRADAGWTCRLSSPTRRVTAGSGCSRLVGLSASSTRCPSWRH